MIHDNQTSQTKPPEVVIVCLARSGKHYIKLGDGSSVKEMTVTIFLLELSVTLDCHVQPCNSYG
jgi:hypothetical protein